MTKLELLPLKDTQSLKDLDTDTFQSWHDELTFQQYRVRESILRETAQCRRAFRIWGAYQGKTRVASIEAFSLPFVYRGLRYVAWNLTRLFVPQEKRGYRFSTRFLQELILKAKSERISVIVIFPHSHVDYYKQFGFIERPTLSLKQTATLPNMPWPGGVVPVDERSPLNQRSGTDVAFVIDEALTFWHRAKSHFHARLYECRYADISGARLRGSHILWVPQWRGSKLKILYRSAAPVDVEKRLIQAAHAHAAKYDLTELEWWESQDPSSPLTINTPRLTPLVLSLDPEIPAELFNPQDSILMI